ncbi:DUF3551 domain-containing protein [Bradyrhizobium sp. 61]|uniref:DUF3551 domain-containing protein n=1 Tax=unclassified Bradyrhizobium TaxID=2631580 RepID=UPI001FFB815C|nr:MULTISPECIES: DUF3551 domain-containing protein [unclassified Bradyrhizobium]MCK1277400.1 DUF3551 domain-containing protein [Bradyrhizobium sp. 61]MCK1447436.1 DUF3551 domain-containing protein [Bradyrhizobium sp. 48]
MKSIPILVLVSATALSALALSGSAATAGPIVPPGHYCISYDEGGTDCSFTSYAQCLETASGIAAECYGKTAGDDENDRAYIPHW